MNWDIKVINRADKTADAQLKNAKQSGYELYEANARHYKLRRPWSEAARKDAGGDE